MIYSRQHKPLDWGFLGIKGSTRRSMSSIIKKTPAGPDHQVVRVNVDERRYMKSLVLIALGKSQL